MSVVLALAALFGGIILVGSAAVFVHDLIEGRIVEARGRSHGGAGSLVFREPARSSERRAASRGGQVVWVKAGNHDQRPDGGAVDQRRPGPRTASEASSRRAWR